MLVAYENLSLAARVLCACVFAVAVNAVYCLLYTSFAGHPETLGQAFAWGIVQIAPWIAAIEIARHIRRVAAVCAILAAALALSLVLETVFGGQAPTGFDLVRRLPGLAASAMVLAAFGLLRASSEPAETPAASAAEFDWAKAAGNYVEFHRNGARPVLARATLASLIERHGERVCRIHRSYVIRRGAIARIDRQGVLLAGGKRLPVGDAYRGGLETG